MVASKSRLDRRLGASVIFLFGFSAEVAEAVFNGEVGGVDVHVKLHCFHFGCVELKEAQFGMDAVFGVHCNHVGLKVGNVER